MTDTFPIQRPPSEQLVDLHVYLLPRESWNEKYHSTYNESISEARSAGFVRVWPELTVYDLRMVISKELGHDIVPPNFVFLRSVGRCMTQIRPKQELELKCKSFLPPAAWAPEIVVLAVEPHLPGVPGFQSYPGFSPRLDTTQPPNGMPNTHFPQVANHDRMGPLDEMSVTVEGQKSIPQDQAIEASQGKTENKKSQGTKKTRGKRSQDNRLARSKNSKLPRAGQEDAKTSKSADRKGDGGVLKKEGGFKKKGGVLSKAVAAERKKKLTEAKAAWAKERQQETSSQGEGLDLGKASGNGGSVRKTQTGVIKKGRDGAKGQAVMKTKPQGGAVSTRQNPARSTVTKAKVIEVLPAKADKGHTKPSSIYIGQNPLVQHALKGDPLGSIGGIPGGKSGRPDAYTNNTNEDSGIAEPTPEDDDPEFERRRSDVDDQHYDQSQSGQGQIRQFQTTSWDPAHRHQEQAREEEEKQRREEERRVEEERQRKEGEMVRQRREEELKEERRREEELKEERRREEEERRREEERQLVLAEEKKRQEAVERKKKEEEEARQQREEMERRLEEELSREEEEEAERERREQEEVERMLEEERQQTIAKRVRAERARAAAMDAAMDDEGEVGAIAMDTGRRSFTTDDEMRRRAEGELADYQPQSSWGEEPQPHPPMRSRQETQSRRRPAEDVAMEMASQEAVQDGLKRVHLTPEIHRKAKVGKIRRESSMDGEDMYETDPEMADLIEQLQAVRQERLEKEKQRETLIKKAKELQAKTYDKRYKARDYWKKRYFDEKKKTPRQEELVSRLRNQVELMHRKLLSHVEGKKNKAVGVKGPPSKKNDHKIAILKMQHDLDEIKRQVDNSRMKLTAEVKLRNQAEAEVRSLKSEVTQRKINMTLIRNQKIAALKSGQKKLLAKTPVPALGQSAGGMSGK